MRPFWRESIRWRFTISISAILIVSVGASFAIIYRDTGNRLRGQIEHDLRADAAQLTQSMRLVGGGSRAGLLAGAHRYVDSQSFRSITTLLFVLVPGAQPVSNYPELFAVSGPEHDEEAARQAIENRLTRRLGRPLLGLSTQELPDVGSVRLLERPLTVGSQRFVVGAGQPLITAIRAQRGVVHSFLLAGAVIALAVLLGSLLVGSRVTAPLRRMARVAARVDGGDLEPRMELSHPPRRDEVGVLATAFNHMLERLDETFRGQREFVADASHELRTPLTVIQGQLEVLANRRDPDRAEVRRVERLVQREIQRMRRIVDDLLLLAQAERPDFLRPEPIELERFLAQLRDDATLIAERRFELGPVPPGRLRADPDRLAQALRNLINNAIDHTAPQLGIVRIEVAAAGAAAGAAAVRIAVLDDGPGIPPAELDRIFQRFHRTAASRTSGLGGAGLGLAIVRAIAEAHGGSAGVSNQGFDGGARFELVLPGFAPDPGPAAVPPPARLPAGFGSG